jgi:Uncharacterized protein conserved in bacteria
MIRTLLLGLGLITALASSAPSSALAQGDDKTVHGPLILIHPWARAVASPAVKNSAAFLTIENKGPADRLIGVSGDIANKLELHTMVREGGVMKMREVQAMDIPANGKLELKPGGMHLMLIGLKDGLKDGQKFPLTLKFEKAGEVKLTFTAEKPGHHHHDHAGHKH